VVLVHPLGEIELVWPPQSQSRLMHPRTVRGERRCAGGRRGIQPSILPIQIKTDFPNLAFTLTPNMGELGDCVRCGAEPAMREQVIALCFSCLRQLERESTHFLLVMYRESVSQYRQGVTSLAEAVTAGPLHADSFETLLTQCEKSHLVSIQLLSELENREPGIIQSL
jgi:hypothetical protein